MMMYNNMEICKDEIYEMYGILNDYLIETNQYMKIEGPLYNYARFISCKNWEIAKITVESKDFLILDVDFISFSYCKYGHIEKEVLKSGMNSKEALDELKTCSKLSGINILNQIKYYITGQLEINNK